MRCFMQKPLHAYLRELSAGAGPLPPPPSWCAHGAPSSAQHTHLRHITASWQMLSALISFSAHKGRTTPTQRHHFARGWHITICVSNSGNKSMAADLIYGKRRAGEVGDEAASLQAQCCLEAEPILVIANGHH